MSQVSYRPTIVFTSANGQVWRSVTDAEGYFKVPGMPPGTYRSTIPAVPAGYTFAERDVTFNAGKGLFFYLTPIAPPSVLGRVLGVERAVVRGAEITLTHRSRGTVLRTKAADRNEFEFRDVEPGVYQLAVSANGFQTFRQAVVVVRESIPVITAEMRLGTELSGTPPTPPMISGRLLDDQGIPMGGVRLSIGVLVKSLQAFSAVGDAVTDQAGRFQFDATPGDTFSVYIPPLERVGYYLESESFGTHFDPALGPQRLEDIRLRRSTKPSLELSVTQIVREQTGQRRVNAPRAEIIGRRLDAKDSVSVTADAQGKVIFPFLASGPWVFTVRDAGRKMSARTLRHNQDASSPRERVVELSEPLSESCVASVMSGDVNDLGSLCAESTNELGQTSLILAAAAGQTRSVQNLLALRRAQEFVEQEDLLGFTALHYAIRGNHLEVVRLLLENGARPLLISSAGISPVRIAQQSSREIYLLVTSAASK